MLMEHTLSTQEKMKYIGRGAARQNRLSFQSFQSSHTDLDCTSLITFSLKSNIKFKQYWKKMTPKKNIHIIFLAHSVEFFFGCVELDFPWSLILPLFLRYYKKFHIDYFIFLLFSSSFLPISGLYPRF